MSSLLLLSNPSPVDVANNTDEIEPRDYIFISKSLYIHFTYELFATVFISIKVR